MSDNVLEFGPKKGEATGTKGSLESTSRPVGDQVPEPEVVDHQDQPPLDDDAMQRIEGIIADNTLSPRDKIGQIPGLLRGAYQKVEGALDLSRAATAMEFGGILNALKSLVKQTREPWSPWARRNIPFISPRARQNWMLLARWECCRNHAGLGVDRLVKLHRLAKDLEAPDPITTFLQEKGIDYDPAGGILGPDIKSAIDTVLKESLTRPEPERTETASMESAPPGGSDTPSPSLEQLIDALMGVIDSRGPEDGAIDADKVRLLQEKLSELLGRSEAT